MEDKKLRWCFRLRDGLKIVEPNERLSKSYLEQAKSSLLRAEKDFNEFWDEAYGEVNMGVYSFASSEILFSVDYNAYKFEYEAFKKTELELENEEE